MRKGIIFLKGVLLSLIPAICSYLGQDDNILDWLKENKYLGDNVDIDLLKNWMNIMTIFFTFALLTIPLMLKEISENEYKVQRDALLKKNKEIFEVTFKNELGLEHCRLNIRIFVPQITLLYRMKLSKKLEYHIRNVEGLAEKDITDNLKFRVYPDKQGIVGDCYNQKAILYDDDLENNNEENYNLNHYQIAKTNQLKFVLGCPIFSKNEEIIAIISFDSEDTIKVREESKEMMRRLILNYTQSLYECVPELFKPKGGIL